MQLEKIDKQRYRKHLNQIIVGSIIILAGCSLAIAQLLIALYPDPSGSHFHWNLTGVIITCLGMAFGFNKIKHTAYMTEVYYVWSLKQSLNLITRKLKSIKAAVEQNDPAAMQILHYYYQGCRQLWQLDDNTITIDELTIWQAKLDSKAQELNIKLTATSFNKTDLAGY